MSIQRSTFLKMSGAALIAGLLALSGCSNTAGGNAPTTAAQPTSEAPSTMPGPTNTAPTNTAPTNTTESSPAPTESSGPPTIKPIPHGALAYANALIVAWGVGDRDRMALLAKPGVLDVLDQYGTVGGPHWDQTASDAGAGSVFVTYVNSKDGKKLELRVENEAASNGQEHAVAEAKFDN